MKKFITLLLVLTGMVLNVSAAKDFYINLSNPGWWANADAKTAISVDNGVNKTDMTVFLKYGQKWVYYSLDDAVTSVKIYRHVGSNYYNETSVSINASGNTYVSLTDNTTTTTTAPSWQWNYMTFRQNIVDKDGKNGTTWDLYEDNSTSHPDGDTFTFELTKAQIEASSNKGQGIRFRLKNGDQVWYNDAGTNLGNNIYPQIYPSSEGTVLGIASNVTSYSHDNTSTPNYWQISIPSYDYEKIVITAKYVNESGYKWKISADAYVTKTVFGENQYATLGCSVPLEIIEANSVTACTLTADASTGKITKGSAITTIPANEGVLLENATGVDKTIRAQVLASAAASASNYLVASGTSVAKVTETGYTNYILANQDEHVGFYMVNSAGNSMGANTAYLHVPDAVAGARAFFGLDDETTAIEAVKATRNMNDEYFNIAGQRVAQPTKGLYIVNGKKVIMK